MSNLKVAVVALILACVCSHASAQVLYFEDFESFGAGLVLHEEEGWEGWYGDSGAAASVSDKYALSGTKSVEVDSSADAVRVFDITEGKWVLTVMQYIPSGGAGKTKFHMQNAYRNGAIGRSVQWGFSLSDGAITDDYDANASASIVFDEWIELKLIIDLDNDLLEQYYDGELFSSHPWLYSGTIPQIQSIDLFGNGASSVYYDDFKIEDYLSSLIWAHSPTPKSDAVDVARDVVLTWVPGRWADTHDIYFGTNAEDVANADRPNPLDVLVSEGQTAISYDPDGLLEFGQTYYWRVDEVNAPPDNTTFKGDVWGFQVEPFSYAVPVGAVQATASSIDGVQDPSNTVNGSGLTENDEHSSVLKDMWASESADLSPWIQFEFEQLQTLDKVHVWNHNSQTEGILGFGIKEALIEYSVDGETWIEFATVEFAQAPGAPTYTGFDVALDGIVAKAVKISGLSNWSILGLPQRGLSEVRFYAVPLRARLEVPADGTADLDPLVGLSWRTGREAAQHQVLIGTDPENLTLVATVDDPAYTAAVDLDSTVYWQINEVNEAADPSLWEGDLWSFDTAEFVTVDDMESYQSRDGSWIWETWTDGFGDDNNGALLGHNGDDMETAIVFDGKQSLPYYYGQGSAASSEAFRDINRDWGQHGIVSLSLMFYGSTSGIAGDMYLKVNDEKIATYPTPADLTVEDWHNWTVDLPAAALGQVDTLAIGFEGGTGWVFIDAIRLYPKVSE